MRGATLVALILRGAMKYRIVTDAYLGFEVQFRHWWFPFWMCVGSNTHRSVEAAEAYAEKHKTINKVVKVL